MQITSSMFVACYLIALSLCGCHSQASVTQRMSICEPQFLEKLPPHIEKVCIALENSNELQNVLKAFLMNEATGYMYRTGPDAMKRTDVDHVFLRFGRRR